MNNKGFGIPHLLAFIIFIFVVIYVFYSFVVSIGNSLVNGRDKNYKNVYRKYFNSTALVVPNNNSSVDSNEKLSYADMEIKLADAGKNFVRRKGLTFKDDEYYYISYTKLISEELLTRMIDPVNEAVTCRGYSKVINTKDSTIYKGYIMCGNSYKTIGYDEKYAE